MKETSSYTIIFSLYGQYVIERGGEIWIGSLIQALGALGFKPGAVRAIVSRMQRKGFLHSRRVARRGFYQLTELGLREVQWGGGRAFTRPDEEWNGRWTVITYSVPEKQRDRRDVLRRSLNAFGFGPLAPGTWISPHPLSPEAEKKWRDYGVWEYVEIFRAEHLGPSPIDSLVSRAWPGLHTCKDRYRTYVARYESVLCRFEAGELGDGACFATRLQSLFEFVDIALRDPALPYTLLPADWPRPAAQSLFGKVLQVMAEPAERFFDSICQTRGENDDPEK